MTPFSKTLPWHAMEAAEIMESLQTSKEGLPSKEAFARQKRFGYNTINKHATLPILSLILGQIKNPIIYVLALSVFASWLLDKTADCIVIALVIIFNALVGFLQELKAHKTITSLSKAIPEKTHVLRDGKLVAISSHELVVGDIVALQAGDKIPADLRVVEAKNLACDESMLTGESVTVVKQVGKVSPSCPLAEKKSMLYGGSYISTGSTIAVVVATGGSTELGGISSMIEEVKPLQTPLLKQLTKLARAISFFVFGASAVLSIIAYLRGNVFTDAIISAITLAVAAIPEGLIAIITITMSIAVRRMAMHHAVIRQLPAIETLGSVSTICTDKTGTLTYNEMMVESLYTADGFATVSGAGFCTEGSIDVRGKQHLDEVFKLLSAATLCSDARLEEENGGIIPTGDPTEVAMIVAARKVGIKEDLLRKCYPRTDVIPFASETRRMATMHKDSLGNITIYVKGSPEELIALSCDKNNAKTLIDIVHTMASKGQRVIAVAEKKNTKDSQELTEEVLCDGLTLLGFIGMIDPPRKEVYQAIRSCHRAGINVKMLTGDHPATAAAIARELGILGSGTTYTYEDLASINESAWKNVARQGQVFARVTPQHKLKLVQALQELGDVVAMTGDGLNDAVALKQADIGIAMGIRGTATAKEAADMVLIDDNFATIEASIYEGRKVYDNLVKAIAFMLATSFGQSFVVFLAILFFPIKAGVLLHPISPIQILWVNLIVSVTLSLPQAFEAAEGDLMAKKPRKKDGALLSYQSIIKIALAAMLMAISAITVFIIEYTRLSSSLQQDSLASAQTSAVTMLIAAQILYVFTSHSHLGALSTLTRNRHLLWGILATCICHLLFCYLPAVNTLLGTKGLDANAWGLISFVAIAIFPLFILIDKKTKNH